MHLLYMILRLVDKIKLTVKSIFSSKSFTLSDAVCLIVQAAVYLWPAWGHRIAEQGSQLMLTHCVSMMLTEELPLLHGLLMQSGLHVGHVVLLWHEQCFLGILDIPNVVLYVTMGVLLGPEWLVYFMLAVLQQQEGQLRQHCLQQGMLCEALISQLDFDIQKALPIMEELQDRWSEKIKTIFVQPPSPHT